MLEKIRSENTWFIIFGRSICFQIGVIFLPLHPCWPNSQNYIARTQFDLRWTNIEPKKTTLGQHSCAIWVLDSPMC